MLQKGPPPSTSAAATGEQKGPGSATGAFHAPPKAPASDAGFLETPNEMGNADGRMGENVTAGREGPTAQGLATPLQSDQAVLGGESANPGHHRDWVKRSARRDEEEEEEEEVDEDGEEENMDDNIWSKPAPVEPRAPNHNNLLRGGRGAATIAGGNFQGVIRDRLKAVSIPYSPDARPRNMHWSRLNPVLKRELVEKFVEGKYDQRSVLQGGPGFEKHPVLLDVARMALLNGSYLAGDGDKLMEKVRSLLPIPSPAAAKGKQRAKQAKK